MQSNVNVDYKRFHIRFALFLLASIFFSTFYAGNVFAKGSIKAGADKAKVCQVCHGKGGHSTNPTYPILAGQHAEYIQKQLKAFKAGTRKDPIMKDMASKLSDQDMEDVAAFFQSNR